MADTTIVVSGPTGSRPPATPPVTPPRTLSLTASLHLLAGMPVTQSTLAGRTAVLPRISDGVGSATVVGLVAADTSQGGQAQVQPDGALTLTVEQWAAIGGSADGLVPGVVYYVNAEKPGLIASARIQRSGILVAKVGVALSATTMLVQIGEPS